MTARALRLAARAPSLARRLSLSIAALSFGAVAVFCAAIWGSIWLHLERDHDDWLDRQENVVRHLADEGAAPGADELRHRLDDLLLAQAASTAEIRAGDGSLFYRTRHVEPLPERLRWRRFSMPHPFAAGMRLDVAIGLDTAHDDAMLRRLALTLLAGACAIGLLLPAVATALVRRGLAPVPTLASEVAQRAAADLARPLDTGSAPGELVPLIEQFNALLARAQAACEQLEAFNAEVAHELRTPLANLICASELALGRDHDAATTDELIASNLEELRRMSGIVNDMLFLSRADRGARARRVPVPSLAALAREVADFHEAALEEAGLALGVTGDAGGGFDAGLLRRALSNLVSNATRHATPGSVIEITLGLHDGRARIEVANRGTPIAPELLRRMFERFVRGAGADGRHAGHGLGLSIVAAIARMHGGRCFARCADGMTRIGLDLPARDD